ncbi:MAG: pirin family protein, partial [Schleiferiaceae bacterium]|nr:pirin family protein [Schleiferiaceae bacterium]
ERPSKHFAKSGGENEIIQFWVNTPAQHKTDDPYYLALSKEQTPTIELENAIIQVVAGDFQNVVGPAQTLSPQTLLRVEAEKGATLNFPLPPTFNTLVYILEGKINSENLTGKTKDMMWFENDGEQVELKIEEDSRFIILSGEPINEPISTYGPFVMNTPTEITQALRDAQSGKLGILNETFE